MFSCKFWEISKNTFFTEHIWVTASIYFFVPVKNYDQAILENLLTNHDSVISYMQEN